MHYTLSTECIISKYGYHNGKHNFKFHELADTQHGHDYWSTNTRVLYM